MKPFSQASDKGERKLFYQMISFWQLYGTCGVIAYKPILIHTIIMSSIFEHYKQLEILRKSVMDKNLLYHAVSRLVFCRYMPSSSRTVITVGISKSTCIDMNSTSMLDSYKFFMASFLSCGIIFLIVLDIGSLTAMTYMMFSFNLDGY